MDAQVKAMESEIKRDGEDVAVWPEDKERFPVAGRGVNILKYSSDSLILLR